MAAISEPTAIKEEVGVAPVKRRRRCAKAKAKTAKTLISLANPKVKATKE